MTRSIRYRSFAPFRPAASFEFLFALSVGAGAAEASPTLSGGAGAWTLALPAGRGTVAPEGESLAWQAARPA